MDDGSLNRFPAGPVVTRKLLDMMEDMTQPGSEPAKASTASNEFGERPDRDGDRSSPLDPPSPKAMSDDALIAELVNNQMTSETAEELEDA